MRPSGAKRIAIGKVSPLKTTESSKPGGRVWPAEGGAMSARAATTERTRVGRMRLEIPPRHDRCNKLRRYGPRQGSTYLIVVASPEKVGGATMFSVRPVTTI